MAENKTKATSASVDSYLDAIDNEVQRGDCRKLVDLIRKATKEEAKMWGPSIVGFGSYHYKYESGREGDWCATGFAARKNEIALYLVAQGADQGELLSQLGKHKMGKSCLYIRRLADVDTKVLEKLIKGSVAEVRRLYG
jgi:hypothetical protein